MQKESGDSLRTCFLCDPDDHLIFLRTRSGIALAGLGPIAPGYSVVATTKHVACLDNLDIPSRRQYLELAEGVRSVLAAKHGACLLSEHGNTPLCEFDRSRDKHCFHPHFLLFPGVGAVEHLIPPNFGQINHLTSIEAAVTCARDGQEYLLISPRAGAYSVILPSGMLPSQFARSLVAASQGRPELTSWRTAPNYQVARENADANRLLFQGFDEK